MRDYVKASEKFIPFHIEMTKHFARRTELSRRENSQHETFSQHNEVHKKIHSKKAQ